MDIHQLRWANRQELEEIYTHGDPIAVPAGRFDGHYLLTLDNPGAGRPWNRAISLLGFQFTPFGVNFNTRRWFFFHPCLEVGRFTPAVAPSRWRATDVVTMQYQSSRLPGLVREYLYDEVKPLGPDLCLGIGGINLERGEGELFFFALHRAW